MQMRKDAVFHLEVGGEFLFGHTAVRLPSVGGAAVKDNTRSIRFYCLCERQFRNISQKS